MSYLCRRVANSTISFICWWNRWDSNSHLMDFNGIGYWYCPNQNLLILCPLPLPIGLRFHFSINIITYFIEFVNIFAQVRRYKIVTKTNHVEVWAFVSWDGWIRTSGIHGSGEWYWIMHQSKFLYYHRKSVALPLGYIPFSINIISYFIIFVKIFIGGSERIRTSEPLSESLP